MPTNLPDRKPVMPMPVATLAVLVAVGAIMWALLGWGLWEWLA